MVGDPVPRFPRAVLITQAGTSLIGTVGAQVALRKDHLSHRFPTRRPGILVLADSGLGLRAGASATALETLARLRTSAPLSGLSRPLMLGVPMGSQASKEEDRT